MASLSRAGGRWPGACVLVLALALSAASQSSPDLTVRVFDAATEEPVYQAEVRLGVFARGSYSQRAFTDSTGSAVFTGLERNNHVLTITHPDYESATETVDVRPSTSQTVSIRLHGRRASRPTAASDGTVSVARLQVPAAARRHLDEGLKHLEHDPARAARSFRRALELHPDYAEAHALLGQALWKQVAADLQTCRRPTAPARDEAFCAGLPARIAAAERSLIAALERDPELRPALIFLGRLFVETRQFARAEAVLLYSARLDPEAWDAPFELARCYYNAGRLEQALAEAQRAREAAASPPEARLLVADVLVAMGRTEDAIAALEDFLLADPASPYAPRVREKIRRLRPAEPAGGP